MFYLYLGYVTTHKVNNLIIQNGGGIVGLIKREAVAAPLSQHTIKQAFQSFTPVNVLVQEK